MKTRAPSIDLVVKRNEIIQGHYSLSAPAQKIAAVVLSKVNPQSSDVESFRFTVGEMQELLGVSKAHYYRTLDQATDELAKIVITHRDKEDGAIVKSNMFMRSKYFEKDRSLLFEFHPDMIPYIRDFAGNFTKYQLQQIQQLNSKFSIRLYELLRKHHPLDCGGKSSFCTYELNDLKGILGIGTKQYLVYVNFRRAVLDRCREEIQETTDLSFSYETIRHGRKVGAIRFCVSHNQHQQEKPIDKAPEPETITLTPELVMLKNLIAPHVPDINDKAMMLLGEVSQAVIMGSLMAYAGKAATESIEKPLAYFMAIVQQKAKEEAEAADQKPKSTLEKLTDRSWAED